MFNKVRNKLLAFTLAFFMIAGFMPAPFIPTAQAAPGAGYDYNLVYNGGAEECDEYMSGWTDPATPHFTVITAEGGFMPLPYSSNGGNVFDLYVIGEETTVTDNISQTIDIFNLTDDIAAGLVNVELTAEARKLKAESIHTLTIELLNDSGAVLKTYFDSGNSAGDNVSAEWQDLSISQSSIDVNTKSIRITLTGSVNTVLSGDFVEFDGVSLVLTRQTPSTPAPVVSSISPGSGPEAGGISVTVTGTDFIEATAVNFGTTAASFTVDSSTQITATAPAGTGTVDVTVTTPAGTSAVSASDRFSYTAPAPEAIGYRVSASAGTPPSDLLGIYIENGTVNGRPCYEGPNGYWISYGKWTGTSVYYWFIGKHKGDSDLNGTTFPIYYCSGGTTPPLNTNFYPGQNPGTGSNVKIATVALAPEINVKGNGIAINNGDFAPSTADHTDFGTADISAGIISRTFTIENTGTAALNLTGTPIVSVSGSNAADFSVTQPLSNTLAAGSSTTFQVNFDPAGVGLRTANISIANNDSDENPYVFFIQGTGTAAPEVTSISPGSGSTEGGTSVTITGNYFTGATAVEFGSSDADSYVVESATQITAVSPAGSAGTVDITVTTPTGTSTANSNTKFTYVFIAQVPTTTTGPAGNISKTGATLYGTVNANGASTAVSIDYGLTNAYGSNITANPNPVTGTGNTTVSAVISGLTPYTTYHYRVTGINSEGFSAGTDRTFTTGSAISYNDVTKTYGDPAFIHTASGGSGTGAFSYTSSDPAVAAIDEYTGSVTILKPGTTDLTAAKAGDGTYTSDSQSCTLTVNKALLTATVGDYSKTYGDPNPTFAVNVTGFVNGETAATASGYEAPAASTTATAATGAGTAAITISGGLADNYTFDTNDTGVLTINKALLTATVGDYSKTYGDPNPLFAVNVTGFKNGESAATASGYGAPAAGTTATAATGAGTAAITISGGSADNYTFDTNDTGVLTINKALLTATVDNYSRAYGEANPAFAVSVTGFKNGETAATASGYTAPTASCPATADTVPGTALITISGGAADNYTFDVSDTGTLTIGKAMLTATVGDHSKTYGDPNPVFEVSVTGFKNGETAATVSGYAAPIASCPATTATAPGTALITISGGAADHYTFDVNDTGVLTINKALLTAAVGDYNRTYGDPNPAFAVNVTGFKNGETAATASGYEAPTVGTTATATTGAGTAAITISGGSADHYTFDVSDTGVLTIGKALLTVTVGDYSRTYGEANPSFTVNVTGFKNGETAATASGYEAPIAGTTAAATTGAGAASITISGGAADNYTFDISDTGVLTINRALLTATVENYNRSYGEANPDFEVKVTGFKNGETAATASGYTAPMASCPAIADTAPGTALITISGGAADNYTFDVSDTGTLTIGKTVLTATVGDYSKTYGEDNPAFTVNVTGFVNGETAATASGYEAPTASTDATAETGAGTAVITISGGAADHYTFDISDQGILTIDSRAISTMVHAQNKYYDGGTETTGTVQLYGLLFNDEVTATGIFNFEDARIGGGKTVFVTGITLEGPDAANYTIADSTTTIASIYEKSSGSDYEPPNKPKKEQTDVTVNGSDVIIKQLTGQMVKDLEREEELLEIKSNNVTVALPAALINIDEVASRLGDPELKDIIVNIEIAAPDKASAKMIENAADKIGYQTVMEPVEFTITCKSGSRTVNISTFDSYVEWNIELPGNVDPEKITTAAVLNQDGSLAHVPTKITRKNGRYYAEINSLINGVHVLIYNPVTFADVENHWAKASVNDMGSRLVISGVGQAMFEPGREITRAEFAAIMVRGLGLRPEKGSQLFEDVDGQWYSSYINTAYQYGIIFGYGDGNFGPSDKITREQAMSMISRAMDITGLKVKFGTGEAEALLAQFKDGSQAAQWAQESIAECVKTGIISGKNGCLAAKDEITRAEVAVIIKKLLQQSDLI